MEVTAIELTRREWFVWATPPAQKPPPPLSTREHMAIIDMSARYFEISASESERREYLAAIKRRDEIEEYERNPPPFVPAPNIPIEHERDGLTWGRLDVPEWAYVWRAMMTEPPFSWKDPVLFREQLTATFKRRAYHGGGVGWVEVFVHEALDPSKVTYVPGVRQ